MAQTVTASETPAEQPLSIRAGDAADVLLTVEEPDPASTPAAPQPDLAVDLSQAVDGTPGRPAVIRAGAKDKPARQANAQGLFFDTSYRPPEGIEILDQTVLKGRALWRLDVPDTDYPKKAGDYEYDVVVTRQDFLRPGASAGTVAVLADDVTVVGALTAFTKAKRGDVIQLTTGPNVGLPRIIASVADSGTLTVEDGWPQPDTGALFEIRRGRSETRAFGPFTIDQDVVRG